MRIPFLHLIRYDALMNEGVGFYVESLAGCRVARITLLLYLKMPQRKRLAWARSRPLAETCLTCRPAPFVLVEVWRTFEWDWGDKVIFGPWWSWIVTARSGVEHMDIEETGA